MNKLPYIAFLTVFFIPFLTRRLGVLPGPAILLTELVAGAILVMAFIYCAYHKSLSVSPKYLILFGVVCLHLVAGAIANSMDPAAVFAGIRSYLRYVPFFLLPLVYAFSDKEVMGQLKFLTVLLLLQFPLMFIQFFVLGWGADWTAGTLVIGSSASVILVASVAVLAALYFREIISVKTFILLGLLFFIPTTLNESKGTLVLLLFGLLTIMLLGNLKRQQIIIATTSLTLMLGSFVAVYNVYFGSVAGKKDLSSFVTGPDKGIIFYLFSGDSTEITPETYLEVPDSVVGALPSRETERYRSRRLDAIILAVRVLSTDPTKLMLGLGIGNASESVSTKFAGQYSFLSEEGVIYAAISSLLWEVGVLGLILYLMFFYFIFSDSRYLSKHSQTRSLPGSFALGWTGVTVMIIVSLPYKNIFLYEPICVLFWYFSGYVVAYTHALKSANNCSHTGVMPIAPRAASLGNSNQK